MYGKTPFGTASFGTLGGGDVEVEIAEAFALSQRVLPGVPATLSNAFAMVGNPLAAAVALKNDNLAVNLTYELSEIYALSERFALTGAPTALTIRLATLSEALGLSETVTPIMEAVLNEAFDIADVPTYQFSVLASLVDSVVLSGAATNTMIAIAQVSETLALLSVAVSIQQGQIDETMDLAQTIEARLTAMEQIVSAAVFTDAATGLAIATVEVSEEFDLAAAPTGLTTLTAAINDGLRFSIGFVFDDTPVIALSMNAATRGLSSYSQFPFNSMTEFNGQYYGAADGGLYRLDGDTDAGDEIIWRIRTGMSNLGTGRNKAMDAAYLGFTATGRVALKCIVVEPSTGEKIVHWYELTETAAVTPRGRRLLVGRGLRSVYWGFELTNVTAGDIELDVIELHPIVLEGRLP
jgi:hypothetical protein